MPWLTAALIVLGLLLIVLAALGRLPSRRRKRRAETPARRIANAASALASEAVRRRVKRRRWLIAGLGLVVVWTLIASSTLAGRPVERTVHSQSLANRDIVLCLDISTSMVTVDSKILKTFSALLDDFDGERVALVVWNTTSQTMVPLTDDYDVLRTQLTQISKVLDFTPYYGNPKLQTYYDTFAGTLLNDVKASSLDGDGLASCTEAFDQQTKDRSRTIILATDNQVQDPDGAQIYSLDQAAALAQKKKIKLISLFASDPDYVDPSVSGKDVDQARADLKQVTTSHGGLFYEVSDAGATSRIVKEIEGQQARALTSDSDVRVTDVPQASAVWLLLGTLLIIGIGAWRRS